MGWFFNLVKPKIQFNAESNVPQNLWHLCEKCGEMIFAKEWESELFVCPKCNFHERIGAHQRISMLADDIKWLKMPVLKDDPLNFKDTKNYKDRLKEARNKTNLHDAALAAEIKLEGREAIIFAMDFNFIGGSMGEFVGSAFLQCAQHAIAKNIPMIAVTASGGARMQEGLLSLMQMPKTTLACELMRENDIPYIAVLSDPTTGGVIASFAMLADITLAEPNALLGFTGPRVIEETMQIKLEPEFQKSEFQLSHGFIDAIVHRAELKKELIKILDIFANALEYKNKQLKKKF